MDLVNQRDGETLQERIERIKRQNAELMFRHKIVENDRKIAENRQAVVSFKVNVAVKDMMPAEKAYLCAETNSSSRIPPESGSPNQVPFTSGSPKRENKPLLRNEKRGSRGRGRPMVENFSITRRSLYEGRIVHSSADTDVEERRKSSPLFEDIEPLITPTPPKIETAKQKETVEETIQDVLERLKDIDFSKPPPNYSIVQQQSKSNFQSEPYQQEFLQNSERNPSGNTFSTNVVQNNLRKNQFPSINDLEAHSHLGNFDSNEEFYSQAAQSLQPTVCEPYCFVRSQPEPHQNHVYFESTSNSIPEVPTNYEFTEFSNPSIINDTPVYDNWQENQKQPSFLDYLKDQQLEQEFPKKSVVKRSLITERMNAARNDSSKKFARNINSGNVGCLEIYVPNNHAQQN